MEIRFMNGHTESMMLPLINYNGQKILYCADLIPSAAHISLPWVMGYDMRPLDTLSEKEKVFNEAIENNWLLFFEHDRLNELGSLQQTEKGVRLNEIIQMSEV